ncbi:MAG: TonB-dependent receptor [Myxococcota bacterium]
MWAWAASVAFAADSIDSDEVQEEIVVTGTRTPHRQGEAPVAVEVIDREAIEQSGSQDVAELLEQHPGIDVTRGFLGAGVRLRGLEADHTLILVDGQRVVGRKDGTYDLSRLPVDAIERIEIVKGASSALYGSDALGGVINIVTRRTADAVEANASVRGGAPLASDATAGFGVRGDAVSLRVDAGWHGNRAWDADPTNVATTGNGARQGDAAARLDWQASDNVALWLRGSYSAVDASGIDLGLGNAVLDRRNLTEDALATMGLDLFPSKSTRWNTTVGVSSFRDQFVSDQRQSDALDTYEETRETLGQLTSQLTQVFDRHTLAVGFEGFLSAISAPDRLDRDGDRLRGAVFLQDEWTVSTRRRLVVVPGLRGDVDSWFGEALAPSLGLRFDPTKQVVLRASGGRGWRAPSFRELLLRFDNPGVGYRVEGNPDLRPEQSWSITAGLEWNPTQDLAFTVQAHRDRLTDLIQIGTLAQTPGLTQFGYINVSEALSQGVEATAAVAPTGGWWSVDASVTVLDARDLTAEQSLQGRAPWRSTAAVRLGRASRGPSLTTRGVLVGPRPFPGQVAPPYALLDARAQHRPSDAFGVFAGVENLLDTGDAEFLPTPPRLLYAGLDMRL